MRRIVDSKTMVVIMEARAALRECRDCGLEAWTEEDLDLFRTSKTSRYGKGNLCKKCAAKRYKKFRESPVPQLRLRYRNMIDRCYTPERDGYENYGGRGITVCGEWRDDRQAFVDWGLVSGFMPELQIDRIDNDGNYSPDNCRWVTLIDQHRNTRRSVTNMERGTRICRICNRVLSLERDFHRSKGNSMGREYVCKECSKVTDKARYVRRRKEKEGQEISHDALIVGVRTTRALDEAAKCRQPVRVEDGVVPFRAWEGGSPERNGLV